MRAHPPSMVGIKPCRSVSTVVSTTIFEMRAANASILEQSLYDCSLVQVSDRLSCSDGILVLESIPSVGVHIVSVVS